MRAANHKTYCTDWDANVRPSECRANALPVWPLRVWVAICTNKTKILFFLNEYLVYKSQERLESWHNHSPSLSQINSWHSSEGSLARSADIYNHMLIFITFFNISSLTAYIQRFWMQITNSAVFAEIFIFQKWVFLPSWLSSVADIENRTRIFFTFFNIFSFTAHIQILWMQITNSAVFAEIFISQKIVFLPSWMSHVIVRVLSGVFHGRRPNIMLGPSFCWLCLWNACGCVNWSVEESNV